MAKNVVVVVSGKDDTGAVFDAVSKHLTQMRQHASEAESSMAQLGERFTRALEFTGIYFGIHEVMDGLKEMVKGAVETGVEIGHLSKQTGISSENLSVLKYAAQQTGVEFETLVKGFKKLSTELFEYDRGSKQAQQAFQALGISDKQLEATHGDLYAVMGLVADQMAKMPDGFQKNAAASQIFGRAGQQLIPVLNEGAAGLEKFRSEAEDLGLVLDSTTVDKMEELHKTLAAMQGSFAGLGLEITSALAPALERMAKDATDLVKALRVSPADALKLMASNALGNIAFDGSPAAALADKMRAEALGDVSSKVSAKTSADNADSAAHSSPGTGIEPVDPEAAKKLQDQVAKAREALRNAQGEFRGAFDSSGYADASKLVDEMQKGMSEKADQFTEDWIKDQEKQSDAAVKASEKQIEATRETAEGKSKLASDSYSFAEQTANFEVQMGQISASQRIAILRQAAQQEYDVKMNALSDMAALDSIDPDHPEKVAKDQAEIEALQATHSQKMVALDQQEVQERGAVISGFVHDIFDPLIEKPKSAADAFKRMADSILGDLMRIEENKLIQSIVNGFEGTGSAGSGQPSHESLGLPTQSHTGVGGILGGLLGAFHKKSGNVASNGGLATGAGTQPDSIASGLIQGKGSSGSGVVVNIITQGTPQQVESSGSSGGGLEQHIISVILKDADTLGPMSQGIGGAIKMLGMI